MGVRMAMGADGGAVRLLVLRQGGAIAAYGMIGGMAVAVGLTRLMTGLLFGVEPLDPVTYSLVSAGLAGVVLLASYLPARRASRIDLVNALRGE